MRYLLIILIFTFSYCASYAQDNISTIGSEEKTIHSSNIKMKRLEGLPPPKRKKKETKIPSIKSIKDAPTRTWTSNKGTRISAQLIGLSAIEANFKIDSGKQVKIQRTELTIADQEYLNYYDENGEFPKQSIKEQFTKIKTNETLLKIINNKIIMFPLAGLVLLAILLLWFVKKKREYKTPKRDIIIGTGISPD